MHSIKKGLTASYPITGCADATRVRAYYIHNWDVAPWNYCAPTRSLFFISTVGEPAQIGEQASTQRLYLMTFNEPDLGWPATNHPNYLDPVEAAAAYKNIEQTYPAHQIIAPSLSWLPAHRGWLDEFVQAYETSFGVFSPHALAFHCHADYPNLLKYLDGDGNDPGIIQKAQEYGIEHVWLTEFSVRALWHPDDWQVHLTQMVNELEYRPEIQTYFYFTNRRSPGWPPLWGDDPGHKLVDWTTNELTAVGELYRNLPSGAYRNKGE